MAGPGRIMPPGMGAPLTGREVAKLAREVRGQGTHLERLAQQCNKPATANLKRAIGRKMYRAAEALDELRGMIPDALDDEAMAVRAEILAREDAAGH